MPQTEVIISQARFSKKWVCVVNLKDFFAGIGRFLKTLLVTDSYFPP